MLLKKQRPFLSLARKGLNQILKLLILILVRVGGDACPSRGGYGSWQAEDGKLRTSAKIRNGFIL